MSVDVDPGSFRDPASRVFFADGQVYRGLSGPGVDDWKALSRAEFFGRRVAAGDIVRTEEVDLAGVPAEVAGSFEAVLRHDRLPFVSYPYEWTFSMLRDAAVLHLELLADAFDAGLSMKDGYAYNVQWRGAAPVFIDVGSFEAASAGPWPGYRQFCQTFLYPLMLLAHKGAPFQPWLRGSVEGIAPADIRGLFGFRDNFRAGVFKHVKLHAAMAGRFTEKARSTEGELQEAGFGRELAQGVVKGLAKVVRKLRWDPTSHWGEYHQIAIYGDDDRVAKERFVRDAARESAPDLALDLGCNDGHYSRIAAEHARYVVAVDGDHGVVDRLYSALRSEGEQRILPLVMNLADPTPGGGWRGAERRSFADRVDPDLVLALALVHHLVISANVPLGDVVAWLRSFDCPLVVEFPEPGDPFVERLLANKPEGMHGDYTADEFERLVGASFTVQRQEGLPCGTRTLYFLTP